jgi:cadmium resistance protein CadD (predicted permease)
MNAVTKPEFQASLHDWWLKLFFVAPILVLLFSIISGLLVFFPGILDLNINSSTAAKLIYTQMVQRKWQRLLFASVWLVIGIIVLAGALLAYFLG